MAKQDRWFIYVPEIEPETFVFFHFKRDEYGRSWSGRDYSGPGIPTPRYAKDFSENWRANDMLSMAGRPGNHAVQAEEHRINDANWYRFQIRWLNKKHLKSAPPPASP